MKVELSQEQCLNIAEFIELYLITEIRDNTDLDNIEWIRCMLDAQKVLGEAGKIENA